MNNDEVDQNKSEKPHAHFASAHEVVIDPVLSKDQKIEALDHLEQDARQLAIASSEGMSGGEETGLQEVLHARDLMELPPITHAYEVVLKDLHLRKISGESEEMQELLGQAIAALEAVKNAGQAEKH